MRARLIQPALLLSCLLGAGVAHAGLFDDDEARKAILDLRQRVSQADQRNTDQAAAIKQIADQLTALRGSLLDLNNQIESVRGDVAKLRGSDEELARNVADLQKRQADVSQAFDDRLRKLEPTKVTLDGQDITVTPAEKRDYDAALGSLRNGDFDKAVAALTDFQQRYPASGYTDSVRFWLGNAFYGKRDYKGAIAAFRSFVAAAPDHPRAPEALLALANSQAETKDIKGARRTIAELMKAYPKSEAAQAGKERLASLR